jgi:hypothetical protein
VADAQAPLGADGRYRPEPAVLERLDRALLGVVEPVPRRRVAALSLVPALAASC